MTFISDKRYTIYDAMERKGAFRGNAANADSRDAQGLPLYKGPVNYPKMYYHPLGEEEVTQAGVAQPTAFGPILTNVRKEMISRVVEDAAQEKEAIAEGWHDHPAKAIAAGIAAGTRSGKAPPMSSQSRISSLEEEIERLTKQLEATKTAGPQQVESKELDVEGTVKTLTGLNPMTPVPKASKGA